jgi:predicted ATP-binding protein involved in virulence
MYLKKIILENVGPIENFEITPEFSVEGNPKPIIIVGENGSGKSIFLSYVINGLLSAQQIVYTENTEVEVGKVYKLRSSDYILSSNNYSFGKVEFSDELNLIEWQLKKSRKEFEDTLGFTPIHKEWTQIPENEYNFFNNNFQEQNQKVEENFNKNVILYFPPNRFEEPAWLNIYNLNAKAEFTNKTNIKGFSNRKIINTAPLQMNKNWLLDVLFDRSNYEIQIHRFDAPIAIENGTNQILPLNIFSGYAGKSDNLYKAILQILRKIVPKGESLRFGINERRSRKISLMLNEQQVVPNIFQMSSGETALLNLFLSILRDFDSTGQDFNNLTDITGIVVVDEIDLHLHTIHQRNVLPELMQLFPKIQFIVTTHSPLFILGLEAILGVDNFSLIQMPTGDFINPEQFSEFDAAYNSFKISQKYESEIKEAIEKSRKPILFVEGDYDIKYFETASRLLGKQAILDELEIKDSGGYGGLDNVKKHFNTKLAEITPQKILLLYDCDIPKPDTTKGNVVTKVIPKQDDTPICKGIENLFCRETIEKAKNAKSDFIDITEEHTKTERGEKVIIPEKWDVNKSEKKNLCDWLCENGDVNDFNRFTQVFEIIEEIFIT